MVLNLLDNAARHTPPGSTVELRLRAEDGDAVLEVADDGPGIPPELRDQVFDRFVRGDGPADTARAARHRPRPRDRQRRRRLARRLGRRRRVRERRRALRGPAAAQPPPEQSTQRWL